MLQVDMHINNQIEYSPHLTEQVFGPFEDGPHVGLYVLFEGGLLRHHLTGELFDAESVVGFVYAYHDGKAILSYEDGFLGLIPIDKYRILNVSYQQSQSKH